jgi:cation:H+ antiporter
MLLYVGLIVIGFVLLWKGSEYFVTAAAEVARRIGVSDLVIGLTLVSMSTTLPEFVASTMASHAGSGGIAVGNAVGSNITNITFILGTCMVLEGYKVEPLVLRRYGIALLLVCLLFAVLAMGNITRNEGILLLSVFAVYMIILSREKHTRKEMAEVSTEMRGIPVEPSWKVMARLLIGVASVFIGARFLVDSAINIAATLNVLESAIGSTIVALGTSLPEFAVSLRALKENYEQISVGNILGANTFNMLWVIGFSALINPLELDRNLMYFNVPLMIGVTILLLVFIRTGYQLKRKEGIVFLLIYILFLIMNYY